MFLLLLFLGESFFSVLGLNEMYVWFLFPCLPYFLTLP